MSYDIDQSGKLEYTSVPTILAFSNSTSDYIYITSNNKRKLKSMFFHPGKPRIYIYKVFACLLFILIKKFNIRGVINIDIEYENNMNLIKSFLYKICTNNRFNLKDIDIRFNLIGKNSSAHIKAINAYRSTHKNLKNQVNVFEIVRLLKNI